MANNDAALLTRGELCDMICEFLEVAVQSVLCYRGVYPKEVFEHCKLYDVLVPISRSTLLSDYVASCVAQAKPLIESGNVERMIVALVDVSQAKIVERFVFEIDVPVSSSSSSSSTNMSKADSVEALLRGFLLKIASSGGVLSDLNASNEHTFSLFFQCNDIEGAFANPGVVSSWLPASASGIIGLPIIVPLKSAAVGAARVQLYVEEDRASKHVRFVAAAAATAAAAGSTQLDVSETSF